MLPIEPTLPIAPHKEDIKAAIRKKGETLQSLRRKNRLGYSALTICLDRPLPRANKVIAEFLELPLSHLWPKWYDADGKRIPLRSKFKHSLSSRTCRSKKLPRRLTKSGGGA